MLFAATRQQQGPGCLAPEWELLLMQQGNRRSRLAQQTLHNHRGLPIDGVAPPAGCGGHSCAALRSAASPALRQPGAQPRAADALRPPALRAEVAVKRIRCEMPQASSHMALLAGASRDSRYTSCLRRHWLHMGQKEERALRWSCRAMHSDENMPELLEDIAPVLPPSVRRAAALPPTAPPPAPRPAFSVAPQPRPAAACKHAGSEAVS